MSVYGVAVTVPAPWGPELQERRAQFGDPMAGAIPPHVTLLPPTEIDDDLIDAFEQHLAWVAADALPFRMSLSSTGTFRPLSPVVFVQVAQGISACEGLEVAVRSGPVTRHLEFAYHPHVTVGHHLPDEALDRAFEALADFRCSFEVATIELYGHGEDKVWRPVRSYALGVDAEGGES